MTKDQFKLINRGLEKVLGDFKYGGSISIYCHKPGVIIKLEEITDIDVVVPREVYDFDKFVNNLIIGDYDIKLEGAGSADDIERIALKESTGVDKICIDFIVESEEEEYFTTKFFEEDIKFSHPRYAMYAKLRYLENRIYFFKSGYPLSDRSMASMLKHIKHLQDYLSIEEYSKDWNYLREDTFDLF